MCPKDKRMKHAVSDPSLQPTTGAVTLRMGKCKPSQGSAGGTLLCDAQEETQTRNPTPPTHVGDQLPMLSASKRKFGDLEIHSGGVRGPMPAQSFSTRLPSFCVCCSVLSCWTLHSRVALKAHGGTQRTVPSPCSAPCVCTALQLWLLFARLRYAPSS